MTPTTSTKAAGGSRRAAARGCSSPGRRRSRWTASPPSALPRFAVGGHTQETESKEKNQRKSHSKQLHKNTRTDAREEIIKPRQKIDHAHTNTHTHGTLLSRKIIFGWKLYTHLAVFSFVFAALGLPGFLCGFRRQGWTAQLVTVVLQVVERLRHLCLSGLQIS